MFVSVTEYTEVSPQDSCVKAVVLSVCIVGYRLPASDLRGRISVTATLPSQFSRSTSAGVSGAAVYCQAVR